MHTRDERTVKFFSPSPSLIQKIWNRSSPDRQNFWKLSVWSYLYSPISTMHFVLPHEQTNCWSSFTFNQMRLDEGKIVLQQCFCLMRQTRRSLWHFQNLTRQFLFSLQRHKHCWSYFAIMQTQSVESLKWQGQYTCMSIRLLLCDQKLLLQLTAMIASLESMTRHESPFLVTWTRLESHWEKW